jgi:hypothetical protein
MRLVRLVTFAAITGGLLFAAEQRFPNYNNYNDSNALVGVGKVPPVKLPHPMSSAIDRMVTGDWKNQVQALVPGSASQILALAQTETPSRQCSIPLTRYRPPDDTQFFILEMPVPRDRTRMDGMPSFQAPVCGEPARRPAH